MISFISSDNSITITKLPDCDFDLTVNPSVFSFQVSSLDTSTINISGLGTIASKLQASVKISNNPSNVLTTDSTGLLVLPQAFTNTDEFVKVSSTDTISGYLIDKLQGTANISVTKSNAGGNEKVIIDFIGESDSNVETANSNSILLSGDGSELNPLVANAKLSSTTGNILVIDSNGLFVPAETYKVKVDGLDIPAYLEDQIEVTSPLTLVKVNGKLRIGVDINLLCQALTNSNCSLTGECVEPVITSQPQNNTVVEGEQFTLSVTATGTGLTYQWQFSDDGTTWTNVGTNASTFVVAVANNSHQGFYRVLVSNTCGTITSSSAEIGVTDVNTTMEYSWGWMDNDAYDGMSDSELVTGASAPVVTNYTTLPLVSGDPLVCDFHLMPSQKWIVVRYPATESTKSTWNDSGDFAPAAEFPDSVFRQVFTVGQFKYIVSRVAMDTDTQTNSRVTFS